VSGEGQYKKRARTFEFQVVALAVKGAGDNPHNRERRARSRRNTEIVGGSCESLRQLTAMYAGSYSRSRQQELLVSTDKQGEVEEWSGGRRRLRRAPSEFATQRENQGLTTCSFTLYMLALLSIAQVCSLRNISIEIHFLSFKAFRFRYRCRTRSSALNELGK
jgi:hypothetical protein